METKNPKEYIAPDIKVIKVLVEKGFIVTGNIINGPKEDIMEKHVENAPLEW